MRELCRRQRAVIDTLSEAVSNLHRGARALKADNAELRAENRRLRRLVPSGSRADRRLNDDGELVELGIALSPRAPGVARRALAQCLGDRVTTSVLDQAQLLVSELVTNSVRHSGAPAGEELVLRVHLWHDMCRVEVEDPGCGGVIAPLEPDLVNGGGMGLHLVQMLSERWGVVRAADGPTRVWAQMPCSTRGKLYAVDGATARRDSGESSG